MLVFKCINNIAPACITELLEIYCPRRCLRSGDDLLLVRPKSRLVSFGDRAFSRAAPKLWNLHDISGQVVASRSSKVTIHPISLAATSHYSVIDHFQWSLAL